MKACPVLGCRRRFKNRFALAGHIGQAHGKTHVSISVHTLTNMFQAVNHRLDGTEHRLETLSNALRDLRVTPKVTPPSGEARPSLDSGVPSFFQDNPWVAILSARGREAES